MESSVTVKDIFTISEKDSGTADGGKERWTKIGIGFVNRDESINIILDATPVNGRLHVRDRRPPRQSSGKS
jgi:hypothetical protein